MNTGRLYRLRHHEIWAPIQTMTGTVWHVVRRNQRTLCDRHLAVPPTKVPDGAMLCCACVAAADGLAPRRECPCS